NPVTGQFVEWAPFVLESRIHGGNLLDCSPKPGKHRLKQLIAQGRHRSLGDRLPFCIASIGPDAKLGPCQVNLVRIQQILAELRSLAQAQRQHAGRQGIQTSGMTRLGGLEQMAHTLQGLVRRKAQWLIEQDDSVDIAKSGGLLGQTYSPSVFPAPSARPAPSAEPASLR